MTTLVLRGAQVFNVQRQQFAAADVLLRDGRIAAVGDVPASGDMTQMDFTGQFLAPGFIDAHTHVFNHRLFDNGRLPADRIGAQQGVACVVDAGSAGPGMIDAFPEFVHQTQKTKAFAFVNIGSPGLPNTGGGHASRPDLCDLPGAVAALERHPDWLVGVKVLASASHTGAFGLEAVKLARKAAELAGKPLMLHIGNAPPVVDDVLDLLRPGDIVTHTYHGKPGGVLTYRDAILPAFRAAVERGVWVDLGHGRSSFSFRVCKIALDAGLPVHSISSDLHRGNVDRYAVSLARTMTKMLTLGLNLAQVVTAVTETPARMLGLNDFGDIRVGAPAHLTAFKLTSEPITLEDADGEQRTAEEQIQTTGVFIDGQWCERTAQL